MAKAEAEKAAEAEAAAQAAAAAAAAAPLPPWTGTSSSRTCLPRRRPPRLPPSPPKDDGVGFFDDLDANGGVPKPPEPLRRLPRPSPSPRRPRRSPLGVRRSSRAAAAAAAAAEPAEIMDASDALVQRALVVGDYRGAVDACVAAGRHADALVLASVGGAELWEETRAAHIAANAQKPYTCASRRRSCRMTSRARRLALACQVARDARDLCARMHRRRSGARSRACSRAGWPPRGTRTPPLCATCAPGTWTPSGTGSARSRPGRCRRRRCTRCSRRRWC